VRRDEPVRQGESVRQGEPVRQGESVHQGESVRRDEPVCQGENLLQPELRDEGRLRLDLCRDDQHHAREALSEPKRVALHGQVF
jgi:hypothetical protein